MAGKIYYFTNDYTTKYGIVKKGDSLTGFYQSTKIPKVQFEFFEKTDKVKADSGEGVFNINESDLKNFATDVAPPIIDTKIKDDSKTTDDSKTKKGFSSFSTAKKTIIVGSGLAVLGLAVWFFVIRKK